MESGTKEKRQKHEHFLHVEKVNLQVWEEDMRKKEESESSNAAEYGMGMALYACFLTKTDL